MAQVGHGGAKDTRDGTGVPLLRVLVVDQDEAVRSTFLSCFSASHYPVLGVSDGPAAMAALATFRPDVVLTSPSIVVEDGRSLVRAVRTASSTTPVIVVADTADSREVIWSLREGAWDYVPRLPGGCEALRSALALASERSAALKDGLVHQAALESLVAARTSELRDRETRLSIVADHTFDWEWWVAPDGQFLYCSPSCERITGFTHEQFAEDPALLDRLVHPDDRAEVQSRMRTAVHTDPPPRALEFRLLQRDGSHRWIDFVCLPVFDEDGTFLGNRGSFRDVTERRKLEAQLLQMQRQESLGRLAAGIAHDLNNLLAPIMMGGDLLQAARLSAAERDCVEMIRSSASRGADLVKQLLLFSRGAETRRTSLDPVRVIRDVARIVAETFPRNIQLELKLPDSTWLVEGDPTQLHQVVLNLCVNARDAMPLGGMLSMAIERVVVDEAACAALPQARPGAHVVVTVADTGTGIAPEVLDKIFDPFFTTKPQGEGTGLGLSTAQGIVASHGGFIDVQSRPGAGASFRVYLPVARLGNAAADAGGEEEPRQAARGRGEVVLVIDDELLMRGIIGRTLQAGGYRVVMAEGGEQGLDVFQHARPPVDLALVDIWMPRMDGVAVIQHLTALKPTLPIIAMSGLSEERERALAASPSVRRFILKPWRARDFLAAIHDVLSVNRGDT